MFTTFRVLYLFVRSSLCRRQHLRKIRTLFCLFHIKKRSCLTSCVFWFDTVLFGFRSFLTNWTQSVIANDRSSHVSDLSYGVPQGSVLGPILFILYNKPLSDTIRFHSIQSQSVADDTQLYDSAPPLNNQTSISSMQTCISDVKPWMLENKLKLNDDYKTEALLICSSSKPFPAPKPITMSVCSSKITFFPPSARNLDFCLTENMSLELQITNICRSAYLELRRISSVRHFVSTDARKTSVSGLVLSKIAYYCNSLLYGGPLHLLQKLQKVHNSATRVVLKARKRDHVKPLLRALHWLPIQLVLTTSCQHSLIPSSHPQLLSIYQIFSLSLSRLSF